MIHQNKTDEGEGSKYLSTPGQRFAGRQCSDARFAVPPRQFHAAKTCQAALPTVAVNLSPPRSIL